VSSDAPLVECGACGAGNPAAARFCGDCGSPLSRICAACGAAITAGKRFCMSCGAPVDAQSSASAAAPTPPTAERRLVSVLFADLVGFTARSEHRDAEETREFLSTYFAACERVIAAYGGTVEKFIGDAVMAVWGAPVAQEHDTELAVRAALELVSTIGGLEVDAAGAAVEARAGVMTGEAAVTIGARGQGMVAGDLVNTASRVQSLAPPGGVLVGDTTRRAAEAAIIFEDAGSHTVKGKSEPLKLWRAVRVAAGRGGALRPAGLDPPFVGREREFRLVKELFHASAEESKAHLVSVVGIAGIGKSRLAWEFEKYMDGLSETVRWHRGRCLPYGEGVTYWALAEMVRMRARIAESDDAESASRKLRECVAEHVADPAEQRWVEPRLAHLLGLEEGQAREAQDMFGAWRLFFERLSDAHPVVMVFEDIQWADAGLLDFLEYLLEWSRAHRIFMVTLGRPELTDRRPEWGAGKRAFTSLYLEPLPPPAMHDLMAGFVPGLGEELVERILDRAEGIPLYAVETVRMLLDRGLLVRDGDRYRPAGPITALEIPETLHALIAARLDALAPGERRVLQDAAVLGKTFTAAAVAAVTGIAPADLEQTLWSLVRKEFLQIQTDPHSPERGQYGFLQDLVQRVAYETLSRRDRKARHLAVAAYLDAGEEFEEDEIVEVVAAHFVDAVRADPDAPDADELRSRARAALTRAGERAASLAAGADAVRYFQQAIELSDADAEVAGLHERAGRSAAVSGTLPEARRHLAAAIELYDGMGDHRSAAHVRARLADVDTMDGRPQEAIPAMEAALAVLTAETDTEEQVGLLTQVLARALFLTGSADEAGRRVEQALAIAETFGMPDLLANALQTKAFVLTAWSRPEEARILTEHALTIALDHDLSATALRAYNNLAEALSDQDRYVEALEIGQRGLEHARRVGDRRFEEIQTVGQLSRLVTLGRWDDAVAVADESTYERARRLADLAEMEVARGDLDAAEARIEAAVPDRDAGLEWRTSHETARARVLRARGRPAEALAACSQIVDARAELGWMAVVKFGLVEAIEAAMAADDLAAAERLVGIVESLKPGELTPFLRANGRRFRASIDIRRGSTAGVDERFRAAALEFRELGIPFWLAMTLLEHAEWLTREGRTTDAAPVLAEAREIFERLGARPWMERAERLAAAPEYAAASGGEA
jgi:class 3 adenylate cyclase/tetratricopeptide (TPR) repeat protein